MDATTKLMLTRPNSDEAVPAFRRIAAGVAIVGAVLLMLVGIFSRWGEQPSFYPLCLAIVGFAVGYLAARRPWTLGIATGAGAALLIAHPFGFGPWFSLGSLVVNASLASALGGINRDERPISAGFPDEVFLLLAGVVAASSGYIAFVLADGLRYWNRPLFWPVVAFSVVAAGVVLAVFVAARRPTGLLAAVTALVIICLDLVLDSEEGYVIGWLSMGSSSIMILVVIVMVGTAVAAVVALTTGTGVLSDVGRGADAEPRVDLVVSSFHNAPFGSRVAGYVLDVLWLGIPFWICVAVAVVGLAASSPELALVGVVLLFLVEPVAQTVMFIIYCRQTARTGQSYGRRKTGTYLVHADTGAFASGWRVYGRELAANLSWLALGMGYLWAAWDPRGQTWHDKIANTVVVVAPLPKDQLATSSDGLGVGVTSGPPADAVELALSVPNGGAAARTDGGVPPDQAVDSLESHVGPTPTPDTASPRPVAALITTTGHRHEFSGQLIVGQVGGHARWALPGADASVMREHARFHCLGEQLLVEDLGSGGQTLLVSPTGQLLVAPGQRVVVGPDQIVQLGSIRIAVNPASATETPR